MKMITMLIGSLAVLTVRGSLDDAGFRLDYARHGVKYISQRRRLPFSVGSLIRRVSSAVRFTKDDREYMACYQTKFNSQEVQTAYSQTVEKLCMARKHFAESNRYSKQQLTSSLKRQHKKLLDDILPIFPADKKYNSMNLERKVRDKYSAQLCAVGEFITKEKNMFMNNIQAKGHLKVYFKARLEFIIKFLELAYNQYVVYENDSKTNLTIVQVFLVSTLTVLFVEDKAWGLKSPKENILKSPKGAPETKSILPKGCSDNILFWKNYFRAYLRNCFKKNQDKGLPSETTEMIVKGAMRVFNYTVDNKLDKTTILHKYASAECQELMIPFMKEHLKSGLKNFFVEQKAKRDKLRKRAFTKKSSRTVARACT